MCDKWADRKREIHINVQQKSICEIFKKSPSRAKSTGSKHLNKERDEQR